MLTLPLTQALTFDDVLLVPGASDVHPKDVDLGTQLTPEIRLGVPLLSAAMDTVTEGRLAIALAQQGGMGIIHKNLPIDRQADEVDKVKRSESGMITDPIVIRPDAPDPRGRGHDGQVPHLRGAGGGERQAGGHPHQPRPALRDPLGTAGAGSDDLQEPGDGAGGHHAAGGQGHPAEAPHREAAGGGRAWAPCAGLITVKDIQKSTEYPFSCKDSQGRLRVGAALGVGADLLDRAKAMVDARADLLCLDSSHGHSAGVLDALRKLREAFPAMPIIAGNVATYQGAKDLCQAGASAVKVGIGPGSICTTRIVTGAGMPQITAILEASRACREPGSPASPTAASSSPGTSPRPSPPGRTA